MSGAFCPRCGEPRIGAFRFCLKCQYDFDSPPASQITSASPTSAAVQAPIDRPLAPIAPTSEGLTKATPRQARVRRRKTAKGTSSRVWVVGLITAIVLILVIGAALVDLAAFGGGSKQLGGTLQPSSLPVACRLYEQGLALVAQAETLMTAVDAGDPNYTVSVAKTVSNAAAALQTAPGIDAGSQLFNLATQDFVGAQRIWLAYGVTPPDQSGVLEGLSQLDVGAAALSLAKGELAATGIDCP
jgi:hypothetical protein